MDDADDDPDAPAPEGAPDLPESDAFGAMLCDHLAGEDTWEVVERDDGWIGPSGGGDRYFADYEEWNAREKLAMEVVSGRVLDVGCGAGRHALYLQEQGYEVTGIDLSPGAIYVARERGLTDVRKVDVREVADHFEADTFDTVLMLGNNFGLVGTAERAPEVLGALAEVTTEDATIVAESRDPTATDDEAHLAYHEKNRERGRLPGALRMRVRYETYATEWYDYLLAAPETMADLATKAGWELTETIGTESTGGDYVGLLEKA